VLRSVTFLLIPSHYEVKKSILQIQLVLGLILLSFSLSGQPFCNQAQTTAGFPSNITCQNAVCAIDPFCCNSIWDALCASTAATNPSCVGCLSTNTGGGITGCNNCNSNFPGGVFSTSTAVNTTVSTCVWGGEFSYYTVVAGQTYTWSTCGSTAFDTQLTLFQGAACGGVTLAYNDDACGLQSTITWTATFSGTVTLLVSQYNCQNNFICIPLNWACTSCSGGGGGGNLVVSTNTFTPPQLITDVLLGSCVSASNISYGGAIGAFGNFTSGDCMGISEGILLTTGSAALAMGPNNLGGAGTNNGTPGLPLLTNLAGAATFDAAFITFNFVSTSSQVTFNYIFASEEYPEFVCTGFNDAFGFFVSGPGYAPNTNVAIVPGTTDPVTINNVNNQTGCPPHYPQYYVANPTNNACTQYDGYTTPLQAVINTVPCATYTITIAIADAGDGIYDSGVFLQAESFSAGVDVGISASTSLGTQDAYEGCDDGYFMFVNNGPTLTEPYTLTFTISGTATMGADYTPISNSITFLPGQDTAYVTISALLDMIPEGPESVIITLPQTCSCDEPLEAILYIIDNLPLVGEVSPAQQICSGQSVTLSATGSGSNSIPYNYNWSNGQTGSSITVSPSATTTYSVTIDDGCAGQTLTLPVTVTVVDEFFETIEDSFCQGTNYVLPNGTTTSNPGSYIFELISTAGCDSTVTLILTELPIHELFIEVEICEGETYILPDGIEVTSSSTTVLLYQNILGCDSTVTVTVLVYPIQETIIDVEICEGESVTLPDGSTVSAAGSYDVTLASVVTGCDSTITTNIAVQLLRFLRQVVMT
jgi:hypothetical protein